MNYFLNIYYKQFHTQTNHSNYHELNKLLFYQFTIIINNKKIHCIIPLNILKITHLIHYKILHLRIHPEFQ